MAFIEVELQLNVDEVNGLIDKLLSISSGSASSLYEMLGSKAEQLVLSGFAEEISPYGKPWAPRVFDDRPDPILVETRAMREGFSYNATAKDVVLGTPAGYATYHQTGTDKMVDRKMLPDTGKPSKNWEQNLYLTLSNWLEI